MMNLKNIMPIILCLLMVNVVTAADEFEINLTSYNAETQNAQIQITNIGNEDYHDLTVALDNLQPEKIVGLFKQGSAVKIPLGAPPGKHTITVSTAEGVTVTKEIDFPKSQSQIKKELEKKEMIKELTGTSEEKKTAERVYETKKTPISNILIIIIALIVFLLVMYFLSKRKRK